MLQELSVIAGVVIIVAVVWKISRHIPTKHTDSDGEIEERSYRYDDTGSSDD